MIPLFNIFPQLKNRIPFFKLSTYPAPIQRLEGLCCRHNVKNLFIKRDDTSGTVYGGNKIRKLEFLLGDALLIKATHVITSGAAGSNHARATTTYASHAKLKSTLMLFDQTPSSIVQENLLADYSYGANMYCDNTYELHCRHFQNIVNEIEIKEGRSPYIIPAGGSSPIGTIGFVNAAFELKQQIEIGLLDEPVAIFTAFGTMGTVAGLVLGTKAVGLKSIIHAARVVPDFISNSKKCLELIEKTNRLLHDIDNDFPIISIDERDFIIDDTCLGSGYSIPTSEGEDFIKLILETDKIELDSVYTGKCGASLYRFIQQSDPNKSILFWNTKNSHPIDNSILNIDFHSLPNAFYKYFTTSK